MNIYTFGQFGKKKKRVTASMVIGKSVCRQNNTNPDFGYVKFDPQFLRKCVGGGVQVLCFVDLGNSGFFLNASYFILELECMI